MHTYKINIILTILASLAPLAYAEDKRCHPVKYLKQNVSNKPDIIVIEALHEQRNWLAEYFKGYHKEFVICQLGSDQSEIQGKLIGTTRVSSHDMEYDSRAGVIYKYAFSLISKIQLATRNESDVLVSHSDTKAYIDSIALDWVTKNMYISQGGDVKVFNVLDTEKPPATILSGFEETYTQVYVFPNEGYIIVETNAIIRYNQDGSNPLVLYNSTNSFYGLALDHYENNIYWLENIPGERLAYKIPKQAIRYTSLNGGEVNTFHITGDDTGVLQFYSHLTIDDKYVYFRQGALTMSHLFRARKSSGEFDKDFDVYENSQPKVWEGWFESILIKSAHSQRIAEWHPCLVNNGGCKRYCVAVPSETADKLRKECIDTDLV